MNKRKNNVAMSAVAIAVIAFVLVTASSNGAILRIATAQEANQSADDIVTTQNAAAEQSTSNLLFDRWSPVTLVESDNVAALFADCQPGEEAVSPQLMTGQRGFETLDSFRFAVNPNLWTWITVVYNGGDEDGLISTGVVCIDAVNDNNDNGNTIDSQTKQTIQNTVNQMIVQGGPINVQHITQVYQSIVQQAINIVNITGNNNTVNQVINQSASNIAATNGTNVNQTIAQNAQNFASQNVTSGSETPEPPTEPVDTTSNTTTTSAVTTTEETTTDEEPSDEETTDGTPPADTTTTTTEETTTTTEEPSTEEPSSEEDSSTEEPDSSESETETEETEGDNDGT